MKILQSVGVFVLVVAILVGLSSAIWGWRAVTAPIRGWVAAEEQIESADSRIYNYNWFHNKCAAIQTLEDQIRNTKQTLEITKNTEDQRMYRQNLLALKNQRNEAINQYNATSRKHYTAARFKDKGLPRRITATGETTCE